MQLFVCCTKTATCAEIRSCERIDNNNNDNIYLTAIGLSPGGSAVKRAEDNGDELPSELTAVIHSDHETQALCN
jgi:hypothetical protein